MISIGRLTSAKAAADYYLERQAGCPVDYYTGAGERRGTWLGRGTAALGLTGELGARDDETFRALLAGSGPDGQVLVAPVLRVDPRGRLDARPLIAAVRVVDDSLLRSDNPGSWHAFDVLARQADRSSLASVTVRADIALAIGTAAGIDTRALYDERGVSLDEALLFVGERIDVRRPGYDVVFAAPKSVSVMFGLAPLETAQEVREAHDVAVAQAMAYLELFVARGARGHQGDGRVASRVATEGLVAASFEHRASRAGDPHLHTHVVVANLLRGSEGQWSAIDSAALYRHQLTAGYVYQAVLRGELTRRLGSEWTPVRHGIAEVVGIPRGLCRAFSQRRQAIEARLEAEGKAGPKAARHASDETRPPKVRLPEETQRGRWREQATDLGYDPDSLAYSRDQEVAPQPDEAQIVAELVGSDGLTAKRSTFDPRDVLRGVCEALPCGTDVDLRALLDLGRAVIRDQQTVPLLRSGSQGERTYSTTDMLEAEATALSIVEDRCHAACAVVPEDLVEALLARDSLVDEQAQLVRELTSSTAGVDVVVGPAGAGKTRTLRVAREAWEAAGHAVVGASLAAVAAQELQSGSGIRSTSMVRFLAMVERDGLPHGAVVVVDEASMIGTRQLLQVLQATAAYDGKVVLVGDPCQLSEIEAGGLFGALARSGYALHLTANQRQAEQWEREALTALRDGDAGSALDSYASHDRIRLAVDGEELMRRVTADYLLSLSEPNSPDVIVLATRKSEVRTLNESVRSYLRAHGLIGEDDLMVDRDGEQRAFARGDEVVVTRNDYRLDLFNGTRARVVSVDPAHKTLRIATRDGQQREVSADWAADRLDHAYAMTCHRAQGITVDIALLYGSAALCREAAYVAMSRGRRANYVYATHDEVRGNDECGLDEHGHEPDEATLLAAQALGEAVARSRRQRLAHEYAPAVPLGVTADLSVSVQTPLARAV